MALPTFVKMSRKPDGERKTLVKYVEFRGAQQSGEGQYVETETCLFLEYLRQEEPNRNLQGALDKMMLVKFTESTGEQIKEVFDRGVSYERQEYHFVGHSRQQLKERTCWLMCEPQEKIHDLLSGFADFQLVEPVGKRANQIGALCSCCGKNLKLTKEEYEGDLGQMLQGPPARLGNGCGLASEDLCRSIRELFGLHGEAPSVVHVRFQTYEGILLKNPDDYMLRGRKALFMTSGMEMFKSSSSEGLPDTLSVVDCSRPYSMGYLDTLSVMMLAEMGVTRNHLVKLQKNYFKFLEGVPEDKDEMIWFMEQIGRIDLATDLQRPAPSQEELERTRNEVFKIQQDEVRKVTEKTVGNDGKEPQKWRVLVFESREVFGVRDPHSELKSNECYFNPTLPDAARNKFDLAPKLLIIHRPCYNPDHIRSLKIVHKRDDRGQKYEHFKDCLVFGGRSGVDKCDGGELGDKRRYFVTWDQNLIPNSTPKAPVADRVKSLLPQTAPTCSSIPRDFLQALMKYGQEIPGFFGCQSRPSVSEETRRKVQGRSDLLAHFASPEDPRFRAEELFMKCASADGISSKKCQELRSLLCGGMDPYANVKKANGIVGELPPAQPDHDQEEAEADEEDALLMGNEEPEKIWRAMQVKAAEFQDEWDRTDRTGRQGVV